MLLTIRLGDELGKFLVLIIKTHSCSTIEDKLSVDGIILF